MIIPIIDPACKLELTSATLKFSRDDIVAMRQTLVALTILHAMEDLISSGDIIPEDIIHAVEYDGCKSNAVGIY